MQNLFFLLELNITLDNHHKGGSLSLSAVSSITYTMLSPSSIQMRSVSSIQWHASPCPGTPVSTSTKVIRYRRLVPEPLPLSVVKTDKRRPKTLRKDSFNVIGAHHKLFCYWKRKE
nr:uncharacterized protein LOC113734999 isoform X2 [Coffea arabica]XP_027117669.1 uncharacterized protein LOC113734999 isoform X2 [Coffea arabica]